MNQATGGQTAVATKGCFGCTLVLGILAAAFLGLGALTLLSRPGTAGLVVTGIGGVLAIATLFAYLNAQRLATFDTVIVVDPVQVPLNGTLRAEVRVRAKKAVRLDAGTVTLRCVETAIARGGTSDTTYTHTAHEEARPITVDRALQAEEEWSTTADFTVPYGLPATFSGRNNFIEWQVAVHITVPGPRLDVKHQMPFIVLNRLA